VGESVSRQLVPEAEDNSGTQRMGKVQISKCMAKALLPTFHSLKLVAVSFLLANPPSLDVGPIQMHVHLTRSSSPGEMRLTLVGKICHHYIVIKHRGISAKQL
jgi:hypothetical protein